MKARLAPWAAIAMLAALPAPSALAVPGDDAARARLGDRLEAEPQGTLEEGRLLFFNAVDDSDAVESGDLLFQELLSVKPGDAVLNAYRAAFDLLRAKHAFWPAEKLRLLNAGLAAIDALIEQHPDNFEVRFLRASACFHMPSILGRRSQAKSDIEYLAGRIEEKKYVAPARMMRAVAQFLLDTKLLSDRDENRLRALKLSLR